MPKYAVHVILIEMSDDDADLNTDILEEDEALGCADEYDTLEEAKQAYAKVKRA